MIWAILDNIREKSIDRYTLLAGAMARRSPKRLLKPEASSGSRDINVSDNSIHTFLGGAVLLGGLIHDGVSLVASSPMDAVTVLKKCSNARPSR